MGDEEEMGSNFVVRLEELEQARANLANLLTDVFEDSSSPTNPATLRSATASNGGTGQMPGDVMRPADAGGSSFGPTGQGIAQITALDAAHGKAQEALLALLGQLNTQIAAIHERVDKTHQAYAATEAQLHVSISRTQETA
jgi:hypothetical protein